MKKGHLIHIRLPKEDGQHFLTILKKKFPSREIIDRTHKILKEKHFIFFPIISGSESNRTLKKFLKDDDIDFQFVYLAGKKNPHYKPKTIREILKKKYPNTILDCIPQSYDLIGDLIIVEFDDVYELLDLNINEFKKDVAKALISLNKNVVSVFEKSSKVKGTFRLRDLQLLWGEEGFVTKYKENGAIFKIDIKNSYFTPRLVFERRRVANLNYNVGEMIIDLFAGVGPFSIQIARNYDVMIHAFDINPRAVELLNENVSLNKLRGKIMVHNMDVNTLISSRDDLSLKLEAKADRIIMNLPEKSLEFLDVACYLLKDSGGILHHYQFAEKPNSIFLAKRKVRAHLDALGWKIVEELHSRVVKPYSPKKDLIVLDLKIVKK